jgi:hypothetical protein
MKGRKGLKSGIKKIHDKMRTNKYFATDNSKMENKPFVRFASIDINQDICWKFRMAKIGSTFKATLLVAGETS